MPETQNNLTAALWYLKQHNYSVIPVGSDKKPLVPWAKYQLVHPTEQEINEWWTKWPEANIGIVTGKISNLTVIDIDDLTVLDKIQLPQTFTVTTGKGQHLYYQFTDSRNTVNIKGLKIDLRSEGGYVIAAPSKHANGKIYKITNPTSPVTFPLEWLEKAEKTPGAWKEAVTQENPKGQRNATFASIIGGQIKSLTIDDFETIGWNVVQSLNQTHNNPPLSERELRTIFNSITNREKKQRSLDSAIKDIVIEPVDNGFKIIVQLEDSRIHIKFKDVISETQEANSLLWIEKPQGLTRELRFWVKLNSDTNKEQWARLLSKAFDKKENKETYPWTILVSEITRLLDDEIQNLKSHFMLSEIEDKPIEWILEPFIQKDTINLLFGLGSSGKTLLSIYFSVLLGTNKTFISKQLPLTNTLFIDYENTAGTWKNSIYNILGSTGGDIETLEKTFIYWDSFQIPLHQQRDKLKSFVDQNNIGLIILDSASMATGDSTSDEQAALKLMSTLKFLRITSLLIAHQRKNDGDKTPIGSIQYENQARNVWNIKSERDVADDRILHIACKHTKANNTFLRKNPVGFKVFFGEGFIDCHLEDAITYFEDKFTVNDQIIKHLQEGGKTPQELAELTNKKVSHIRRELSRLKDKNRVVNSNGIWQLQITI